MSQLGISLYPEQSDLASDLAYLQRARDLGYRRVFTSLLQVPADPQSLLAQFEDLVQAARDLDFEVIADINGQILAALDIDPQDLSYFKEMGLSGVRLDNGLSGSLDAQLTRNPQGLTIELNMSHNDQAIDQVMAYQPNLANLIGSHNFYPQAYTGLSLDRYLAGNAAFDRYNLRTMAFVNAPSASFGPWPLDEGLCTLEVHRHLPITTQVAHLKLLSPHQDIVIANAYASQEDLQAAAQAFFAPYPSLRVVLDDDLTETEGQIVLAQAHTVRGDTSDYMVRSSHMRLVYQDQRVPQRETKVRPIQIGDLLVNNEAYGRYAGELQIARRPMPYDGRKNIIGHVHEEDLILLESLPDWSGFALKEVARDADYE